MYYFHCTQDAINYICVMQHIERGDFAAVSFLKYTQKYSNNNKENKNF